MSEAALLAIINVAFKFGWPAALAAAKAFRGATPEQAIAALEEASKKSADQYLEDARKAKE